MNVIEIRKLFVGYYQNMGYKLLPSASMIDPSIPMSFVMSAGLVQVENSLVKTKNREGNQFVLVQNCFRHFDLDKVGTDDIHLSFFEMPGAFVFGPNGKTRAIHQMWTLATSVLGIDNNQIWVSYFKGGNVLNSYMPEDKITRQTWLEIGLPENHVIGLGVEHNYWMQGKGINRHEEKRKCGPNTELFFDRGEDLACGRDCLPGCKCGRFVEFSNSLFINSEITEDDELLHHNIAHPFTETVIGIERVAMIQQKAPSVFETNGLKPVVEAIHRFVHSRDLPEIILSRERIIADHMKGLYFLIANGAPPPGKDGRARIIKVLIRRIVTLQIILGINSDDFFPAIMQSISQAVPDVIESLSIQKRFESYFSTESQRFSKTIERGIVRLTRLVKQNGNKTLSGSQIVCLEKQWGLPIQLISIQLKKKGLAFNEAAYQDALRVSNETIGYNRRQHHANT